MNITRPIIAFLLLLLVSGCGKEVVDEHNSGRKKHGEITKEDSIANPEYYETYSVEEFIRADLDTGRVWVAGYIVGACSKNIKNAEWERPFSHASAVLLADRPGERALDKIISIQLRNKKMKNTFALSLNPENLYRRASFHGSRQKYLGIVGMKKDIDDYGWRDLPREESEE